MGCDVHMKVLLKRKRIDNDDYTGSSTFDYIRGDRDYRMFAKMANVRNYDYFPEDECFKPRGLFKEAGPYEFRSLLYYITDEIEGDYECTEETANKFIANGSRRIGNDYITNPDYHSYSWLTVDELESCVEAVKKLESYKQFPLDITWFALLNYMKTFTEDYDVMLVFVFDN